MATIDVKSGVTSTNLNLTSTTLNVSSGGKIVQTTLNSGAVANIYGGAQGSSTDVTGGGQIRVYSNAVTEGITGSAGAMVIIYAGGTASNVVLNSEANVHLTVDNKTQVTGSYVGGGNFSVTGGTVSDFRIGSSGSLTAYTAGISAVNISQSGNGRLNFNVAGNQKTYIQGTHQSGSFLLSGGVASGFLLNDDVVQNVSAGGIASATILYGDQYISNGTAIETQLYGNQLISAKGKSQDVHVYSGGKIIVVEGYASGVTLEKGGTLVITDGSALNVNLSSGGIIQVSVANSSVEITGTAEGRNFSLADNIASGFTLYAGGCLDVVEGVVVDTVLSSGATVNLYQGQLRALEVFKGGTVTLSGGTAQVVRVATGGKMFLSGGYAEGTVIDKNGLQSVSSGAVAVDTVAAGSQFVYAGGSASGTTLLSGGRLSCFASAVVEDVLIGNGARIFISGAVSDVEVCSGGTAFVYNKSLLTGDNVLSGGAMNFSGGASVQGTLTVYGGLLSFSGNNVASGAEINLDLTGIETLDMVPLMKGYDNLSGDFALNAKIAAGQVGEYYVASSAAKLTTLNADIDSTVAALQAGSAFVDYANKTEYALTGAPGYVYVSGAVSTKSLAEISGAAAMQTVNGSDKGAKWGNETTFAAGNFFAGNGATNNVWLEVDTANSAADTILYGGAESADLAGKVSLNIAKGDFKAIMGGAKAASGKVGAVDLAFAGGTTGVIYGGGFGSVDGDVTVSLDGSAEVTGQLYGGAMVLAGAQTAVGGTITLDLKGGNLKSDVIGGARVQADTIATSVVGDIAVNIGGASFSGGKDKCIYGGGWIVGKEISASRSAGFDYSAGDVTISVNSDVAVGTANGRGIFGGAFVSSYAIAEVDGDVNIAVTGATVGNVFGGGWAQTGAASNVNGKVSISVTNGAADIIYGGGAHGISSTVGGTTNVSGDIAITIDNGTVNRIFAVGQTIGDTVEGSSTVTIKGNSTVDYVFGTGFQGYVGSASTTLSFVGFTGNIQKELAGFNAIVIDNGTAATFASDAEISGSAWTFQLEERTRNEAVLTWKNGAFGEAAFHLDLGSDAAAWTVCDLSGDDVQSDAFSAVSFDLEIGGTTLSNYQLGTAISGTGTSWDGATLDFNDETGLLKFTLA